MIYALHGFTQDESYTYSFFPQMQDMLRDGEIQEMILVSPNANNALGGSNYLSSPTIGDYETYITEELVDYVDANYRTIPTNLWCYRQSDKDPCFYSGELLVQAPRIFF